MLAVLTWACILQVMAIDEVPLAYLPGGIVRLHVQVIGDLQMPADSAYRSAANKSPEQQPSAVCSSSHQQLSSSKKRMHRRLTSLAQGQCRGAHASQAPSKLKPTILHSLFVIVTANSKVRTRPCRARRSYLMHD